MLDGVIFVERTQDEQDLKLLAKMLKSEPSYERWKIEMTDEDNFTSGFGNSYDRVEDDVLYVKIDDDIVSCHSVFYLGLADGVVGVHGRQRHPLHNQEEDGTPRVLRRLCQRRQPATTQLGSLESWRGQTLPSRGQQRGSDEVVRY